MPFPNNIGLVNTACEALSKAAEITETHMNLRRGSRRDFNLFYALVNSRAHLEKYHTNFIAYLLNPEETHYCGHFFLNRFLLTVLENARQKQSKSTTDLLQDMCGHANLNGHVEVNPEKDISTGRIDIEILFQPTSLALYVENKVRSDEGHNQVFDYFTHYEESIPGMHIGIYLTKYGQMPGSIKSESASAERVIPMSYRAIVDWLEGCCLSRELISYPNITGGLLQYIQVVKNELKIMENLEKEEMAAWFQSEENKKKLVTLLTGKNELNGIIETGVAPYRKAFLRDLKKAFQVELAKEYWYLSVNEKGAFHCRVKTNEKDVDFSIYVDQSYPDTDDGGKGLWWGIYNADGKVFPFEINLSRNCWEPVWLNEVNDFENDEAGSAIILKLSADREKRDQLFFAVNGSIIKKIKDTAIPALEKQQTKPLQ